MESETPTRSESLGDIRTMSPEEHWRHFAASWRALKTYTYLGKGTPFLDIGVDRETMPLRHDMRNSTGGVMATPLCILAPEPWWRDDECVPAPVTMSYAILDPGHGVRRLEVLREVLSVGRQVGFSRSRIVDADDHAHVIALSTGSGVSLGDVPPGFELIDNPVTELVDSPNLPRLRDVFGVIPGPEHTVQIDKVTPAISSPHAALHQAAINLVLEAAAIDEIVRLTGSADFQVEAWNVVMTKPGHVGPFVARATVIGAGVSQLGIEATLTDSGHGGRIMASVSATFRRVVTTSA